MKEFAARPKDTAPPSDAGEIAIDPALPCEPVRLLTEAEIVSVALARGRVAALILPDPSDVPGARRDREASGFVPPEGRAETREASALDLAHDRYFRIGRAGAGAAGAFPAALAASLGVLAFEFGDEAASPGYAVVEQAIGAVLARFGGVGRRVGASARGRREVEPFGRWIRGHQIFAVLTQGLIHAFLSLEAAVDGSAGVGASWQSMGEDVPSLLGLIATLLAASAASLRLTGAFDPDAYQQLVRPSMAPPHVPRGFSGLLSADHRHLVQTMMRLRPCLAACEARFPAAHAAMQAALASVYDSHKHVCARFAGETTPSLRMKAASARSGVEQLDNFKRARLRLLSQAPQAG